MEKERKRFIFLNALPLNAFRDYMPIRISIVPVSIEGLKGVLRSWQDSGAKIEVVSYIRHPSTVKLLSEALGIQLEPTSGLYRWQPGDAIIVVTLKRPPRGREVEATLKDIDIYLVVVESAVKVGKDAEDTDMA